MNGYYNNEEKEKREKKKLLVLSLSLYKYLGGTKMKKENVEFVGLYNNEENLHITLKYYGISINNDRTSLDFFKRNLGKEFEVSLIGMGEYERNGIILNKGYLVDRNSLLTFFPFIPEVPHITIFVNRKKGGKAKDTNLCTFQKLEPIIKLKMRLAVFRFDKIEYYIED